MADSITFTDMLLRLAAAAASGALVGFERQIRGKPAGLRTNILVALGAAGFILATLGAFPVPGDPGITRVLQGIVGGIGFLGAGAILHSRGDIHGITTAAAMWVVAAIGSACGIGEFHLAAALVIACVVTLYPLGYIEDRFETRVRNHRHIDDQPDHSER